MIELNVIDNNTIPLNIEDDSPVQLRSADPPVNGVISVNGKQGMVRVDELTDEVKRALLLLASKVTYVDDDGQDYYDALEVALYPDAALVSISAVYTQSGTVYDIDSLDSLETDLVVTAHYDDSSTAVVTAYTLSGTLTAGTSTITVAYSGKTTTFDVTVTGVTYLFKDGDECTSITGGWQTKGFNTGQGTPTATNNGEKLVIGFNSTSSSAVARSLSTKNAINMNNFTKIVFIGENIYPSSTGAHNAWCYFPTTLNEATTQANAYGNDNADHRVSFGFTDQVENTKEFDVDSKMTGTRYLSINYNCFNGFSAPCHLAIRQIYAY